MIYLHNCTIYTGEEILKGKAIAIKNDKITRIIPESKIPTNISNAEKIDLKGLNIAPGFIDLQVNGGGGVLFNNTPTTEGIKQIYNAHLKFGTTNILPTFITGDIEQTKTAIKAVQKTINNKHSGILGIHIEGPFINKKSRGVHNPAFIKKMSKQDAENIPTLKNGATLLTFAPEVAEPEAIKILKSKGIILSIGHTDATYREAQNAFKTGVTGATHLFNAMRGMHHRAAGTVGAILENENIWAGIIADGYHIHYPILKIAYKCKPGKLFLVTDSMPPVGAPKNKQTYILDGKKVTIKDGVYVNEDGIISGSALDIATAVRNCIKHIDIPKDEALRMASTYPAKFIGIGDRFGYIKPNYIANLTIFDNGINVKSVVVGGKYNKFK